MTKSALFGAEPSGIRLLGNALDSTQKSLELGDETTKGVARVD